MKELVEDLKMANDNLYCANKMLEKENKRLNNIIKRFEVDLYNMYITFGEFSEEYTEKKIKEIKGSGKE